MIQRHIKYEFVSIQQKDRINDKIKELFEIKA